jgi:hypothetical protein
MTQTVELAIIVEASADGDIFRIQRLTTNRSLTFATIEAFDAALSKYVKNYDPSGLKSMIADVKAKVAGPFITSAVLSEEGSQVFGE